MLLGEQYIMLFFAIAILQISLALGVIFTFIYLRAEKGTGKTIRNIIIITGDSIHATLGFL